MLDAAIRAAIFGAGNRGFIAPAPEASEYAETVISYSPIAYWRLGESSGLVATDEVGATHGAYVNTPTLGTASLLANDTDTAVAFTVANNDHMKATNHPLFNIATMSISAIIQVSAYPLGNDSGIVGVMDTYDSVINDKALRMQTDGRVFFYVFDGAQKVALSTDPVPLNEPVHIVGVIADGFARIYVNGRQAGTVAASTSSTGFSTASIVVGGASSTIIDFDGTIDEVSVYNRELIPLEVLNLYEAAHDTVYRDLVVSYAPTAYWRLGEPETTTIAYDTMGNHNGAWQDAGVTQGVTGLLVDDADTCTELHGLANERMQATTLETNPANVNSVSCIIDITPAQLAEASNLHVVFSAAGSGNFNSKYFFNITGGNFEVTMGNNSTATYRKSTFAGVAGKSHIYVEWPVGDEVTGELILYIDGVKQTNTATEGPTGTIVVDGGHFVVGNYSINLNTHPFDGKIDEVAVFDRALTPAEILDLYDAGINVAPWDVSTATYSSKFKNVSTENGFSVAIEFSTNGTNMYVFDFSTDSVHQYTVGTAWDVSTASYDSKQKDINAQSGTPRDVTFSVDGTKMYVIGDDNNTVFQYTLSPAWDVSTASYTGESYDASPHLSSSAGLRFKSDGTKMYILSGGVDLVYQFTLGTAWDITGIVTYDGKTADVGNEDSLPVDLTFSSDGFNMYTAGQGTGTIYQYALNTAWDISTASYSSKFKVISTEEPTIAGVDLSSDGTKMYIAGAGNVVYQYTLG